MKEYRVTLTINVFINAEDEEDAQRKFEDMEIRFHDPDTCDELQSDLIDSEIFDIDEEIQQELDQVDLDKAMKRARG
jgi:hypothetical protein